MLATIVKEYGGQSNWSNQKFQNLSLLLTKYQSRLKHLA